MSFRRGGEVTPAITGHWRGRRAYCGMQAERNHAPAIAGTSGCVDRRWRSDHLRCMSAQRSRTSLSYRTLFVQIKLWSGSNHRTVAYVEFTRASVGSGFQRGRWCNHCHLRKLHRFLGCIVHVRRRRYHRTIHLWRKARDLRRGHQRGWRNWHQRFIRPGNGVRQRKLMLQLNLGRSDNGLRMVVGSRGHGNNRLSGELGISFLRLRRGRGERIEWRQIF